jgi:Temperature dependent protein affecting M2 dsRNA replication
VVVPLEAETAPDDLQECIGLKLPEELFYYIFVGMISPKVPQWLNSSEILIQSPYEGAEISQYQHLIKDQLGPLRQQCLSLLAFSMYRSFHYKTITTRFYMGPEHDVKFNIRDLEPLKNKLSKFNAREELLTNRAKVLKVSS